ncbi:hypothetical protein HPP92_017883 [Vanilla planifolia]|uniref:Uncharacterized protein n=1 Tax=Vanilla planifolia TaxID=51239 RepID=A0A835QD94_VANPL|nr:hypothetical protein HPP92_017883 [Vanilla planifolia]
MSTARPQEIHHPAEKAEEVGRAAEDDFPLRFTLPSEVVARDRGISNPCSRLVVESRRRRSAKSPWRENIDGVQGDAKSPQIHQGLEAMGRRVSQEVLP